MATDVWYLEVPEGAHLVSPDKVGFQAGWHVHGTTNSRAAPSEISRTSEYVYAASVRVGTTAASANGLGS